jgi:serine/threonine-protein kinase
MRPQVGQVINNKYRLLRLIGDGGMGSVFEARHEVLGTTVALKFLHPELGRRAGLVQRFLQEARVSAQIQSPHVVRVSDVDQTANGLAFIVMEYIEGRTLQTLYEELYRAGQRLSYGDALEYAMQMLEGVDAAHQAGVVHRDLKPDNVMIAKGPKGEAIIKLLDFGIAKLKVSGELEKGLTRPGVVMGTPEYMAPEQAFSADAVDARADVFSLGVIVFEMLAGRRPVGGDDPHQIAAQYLSGQVAKLGDLAPWVPAELAAAVHHAMAAKPQDRTASIAELRTAIEPFARDAKAPSTATPTPPPNAGAMAASGATSTPQAGASAVPKTLPPEPGDAGPTPLGGIEAPAGAYGGTTSGAPAVAALEADAPPAARPGGTAIGAPPFGHAPTAAQTGHGGPQLPGTAPMTPLEVGGPTPAPVRKRGGGASLALILLLAAGIAGLVVGGVFIAQQYAKVDDHHDDPPIATSPPPPATVPSEPATAPPSPPPQMPIYTPPPQVPATKPPTHASGSATAGPAPSTHPTAHPSTTPTAPTGMPPILPSSLPTIQLPPGLGIPGLPPIFQPAQPGGGTQPGGSQPGGSQPGGGTQPGGNSSGSGSNQGGPTSATSQPSLPRPPIVIPPRQR